MLLHRFSFLLLLLDRWFILIMYSKILPSRPWKNNDSRRSKVRKSGLSSFIVCVIMQYNALCAAVIIIIVPEASIAQVYICTYALSQYDIHEACSI